jgi:rare lipoprotein A
MTKSVGLLALAGVAWLVLAAFVRAETCRASLYRVESSRVTASGERFQLDGFTAAHRTPPFGARLRVLFGRRSIIVRANDLGPFAPAYASSLARAPRARLVSPASRS